ncbi:hypothetical protein C7974DRAFT_48481 [Boeremia exigua]|uniref:uncharacterized protein n=1 Tax=Boeremia exigua TaxID=749465 RepID=UPI001E8E4B98|nr:uncharacterized protein C7974DRAFT_48481 [Boeremia exigua]KAH6616630.1 hypothetical protein C7974DRAFT_48481 [Boeremia exigua]
MDEPPRKRRKASSPLQAPSSPLRKPPRRPSFASPTKASLARNYPNLLPTRTPPRDDIYARTKQAGASILDEHSDSPADGVEEVELSASKAPEAHKGPNRDTLFASPSKRPPHGSGAVSRSPLKDAPALQQNQLTRPVEDTSDADVQDEKTEKSYLDPTIEQRKREKARLQREVEELEAQVSRCTKEIMAEQQRAADDTLLPAQRTDLVKFVAKISGADPQDERPTPVSSLICSFLPFTNLSVSAPKQKQPEKPIASHRPVQLKEPLPYLEMFTSLNFSKQLGLPRGKVLPSSKRIHQKHTINISSPQMILTAQVAVNIDCLTNKVIDMHLLRLTSWAERELGTFMRARAKENDLGNACWAVDSFWDVATKRAQYWHRCEKAFARLLPGRTGADAENVVNTETKSSILSRKDLSRHLGRDVLILQDKHVLLKINWRIVFDWTGEAESNVNVECAVPAVWNEADASDTFQKVPETFDSLLRMKGTFEATKIMVTLLFSQ